MCGIAVGTKEFLLSSIDFQRDRGLDSLGLVGKNNIYKATKEGVEAYSEFIDKVSDEGLIVMHHRKATVGNVSIENAHPFVGDKFVLIQNGTIKSFNNLCKDEYGQSVDSHNLLHFIEEFSDTIDDIPKVMDEFKKEYKDDFGIIIVLDKLGNAMFCSDGARESYIDVSTDGVLVSISNYKSSAVREGYKNIGYLKFNLDGDILDFEFEGGVNTEFFKKKYDICSYQKPSNYSAQFEKNEENKGGFTRGKVSKKLRKNFVKAEMISAIEYIGELKDTLPGLSYDEVLTMYLWDTYGYTSLKDYFDFEGYPFPSESFRNVYNNYYTKK